MRTKRIPNRMALIPMLALAAALTAPMGPMLPNMAHAQDAGPAVAAGERFPVIFEAVRRAVLSAERAGVLNDLKYEVGAPVKKGAIIAQVDNRELVLQKKRGELSLKHMQSRAENLTRLSQKGLATNEDLAEARMQRDVIKTDIDIIEHQIGNSYVRAPFDCVVVRRHAQPHEWMTVGKPVVEVVDPASLRAAANIPSALAVHMKAGDTHDFYVYDMDMTVKGTVSAVVPLVDELSNTAQVVWSVKNTGDRLLAGMKGDVRIERR